MGHERERTLPIDTDCLAALESRIGYRFRDRALLCRALTHSSYSNETGQRNHHLLCNERLEFLGDSVLSLVVSEFLFTTYRELPEGDLTCLRKDVVCADALARYARQIGLGDCLLLPCNMLRSGKNVFLDDVTVEEVEERLKTPVQIIDEPGSDLVKAVVEENQEMIHRRRTMYEQADCSNCGPAERG